MSVLFMYIESINGYNHLLLIISSLAAIICGILVLISKNPIISILFLIGLFLSISGYLLLIGISFIGISYLVVYIGAVSILFLFILMLINIRVSELLTDTRNSIPLSILAGIFFSYSVYQILPNIIYSIFEFNNLFFKIDKNEVEKKLFAIYDNKVYYATSNEWDGSLVENSHITSIGNIMYTSHYIWLILTSMILLLAMIGAILITYKPTTKKLNRSIKKYTNSILRANFSSTSSLKDPYSLTMAYAVGGTSLMPLVFTYFGLVAVSLFFIEIFNVTFTEAICANPQNIPIDSFIEGMRSTDAYSVALKNLFESIKIDRNLGLIDIQDLVPYYDALYGLLNRSAVAYEGFLDMRSYIESMRCVMSQELLIFNSTGYYFSTHGPNSLFDLLNEINDHLNYPRLEGNFESYAHFLRYGPRN
jgi:NADH-ubiquinone oxidoreductase chain 6